MLVFALAGISDWLDGFAARKLKAGSDFGRMLDPIADKVLVAVALMMLVAEGTFTRSASPPACTACCGWCRRYHSVRAKSWSRGCANSWQARG